MRVQCLVIVICLTASLLCAQEPGEKIVVKNPSAELKSGKDVVGKVSRGTEMEILKVNGDWLWVETSINDKSVKGWIHRTQVQPAASSPPPSTPAQAKATSDENNRGTLWIGEKTYKLQHVLAYRSKVFDDDPNLFTIVKATAKPIPQAALSKLEASLKSKGDDSGFHVWDAYVQLTFDPDGGLMNFNAWADNVSLSGNTDSEYEFTEKDGMVIGHAVMEDAKEFFDMSYRYELKFNAKLFGPTESAESPDVAKQSGPVFEMKAEPREFSASVTALPFPPDAAEIDFDSTFKDVEYVSNSPLTSLTAYYRMYMTARGWKEDESAASIEFDEVELTFQHGDAEVVVELADDSDGEVEVELDCEGLTWDGINDPAGLAALGIPQPRSLLTLQKEIPRPNESFDIEYSDDECKLKCRLNPKQAANYYSNELQKLGWKSSSRPFLTDNLCKVGFSKDAAELDVTIFSNQNPAGSRVTVAYKNETPEPVRPRLAMVAGAASPVDSTPAIDVATVKGTATVDFDGKKHTFKHVVAYQTENYGDHQVLIEFSKRPIPFEKMQKMINKDDFSFSDLYQYSSPDTFGIFLNDDSTSISISLPGIGIGGASSDFATRNVKVENGRIKGTFKMTQPDEVLNREYQYEATIDAPILRPAKWGKLESLEFESE